jgi:hypothetical protein
MARPDRRDLTFAPPDEIRIAQVVAPDSSSSASVASSEEIPLVPFPRGDYDAAENIAVVFLYARLDGGVLVLTERSASPQALVGVLGDVPEVGKRGFVARINGTWIWVGEGLAPGSSSGSSSSGDCFTFGVPMEEIPDGVPQYVVGFDESGCVVKTATGLCPVTGSSESVP